MSSHTHTVWLAERRPCWHCRSYEGLIARGSAALCRRPGSARVRAMPASGCCSFEREVGSDDEPDRRPGADMAPAAPYCLAPSVSRRASDTAYGAARAASIGSAEGSTPAGSAIGL